jgi:hypothetical protein
MIEEFVAGVPFDAFRNEPMRIAAVERHLQKISEAAVRLGDEGGSPMSRPVVAIALFHLRFVLVLWRHVATILFLGRSMVVITNMYDLLTPILCLFGSEVERLEAWPSSQFTVVMVISDLALDPRPCFAQVRAVEAALRNGGASFEHNYSWPQREYVLHGRHKLTFTSIISDGFGSQRGILESASIVVGVIAHSCLTRLRILLVSQTELGKLGNSVYVRCR